MSSFEKVLMMGDQKTVGMKVDGFPRILFLYSESDNQGINASNIVAIWKGLFPDDEITLPKCSELMSRNHIKVKISTAKTTREESGYVNNYIIFEKNETIIIVDTRPGIFSKEELLARFLESA